MRGSSRAFRWGFFSAVYALLLTAGVPWAADGPPQAAIASAHPLATDAGFEILTAGGNAFDAAVAVSAALAVGEPYSSGLGGGGFWLLHRTEDGRELMLDGRERAPLAAQRDLYLDADDRFVPELSLNGHLAAGIPGEPAALVHMAEHYGRLPLARSLAPAIRLARAGFAVDERYRRFAKRRLAVLLQSPAAAGQFLQDGEVPPVGALGSAQYVVIVQYPIEEEKGSVGSSSLHVKHSGWWNARPSSAITAAGGWSVPRRPPPAACSWCRCSTCPRVSTWRPLRMLIVPTC